MAAIGGWAFAIFWTLVALDIAVVPWSVSLPLHAFAMVTLSAGVLSLQRSQFEVRPDAWWGWISAGAVTLFVFFSFELFLAAAIAFAAGALVLGHLSRTGAAGVVLGALIFIAAFVSHGPFWSQNDPKPAPVLAALFVTGLAVMAGGWTLMGLSRVARHPPINGTSQRPAAR